MHRSRHRTVVGLTALVLGTLATLLVNVTGPTAEANSATAKPDSAWGTVIVPASYWDGVDVFYNGDGHYGSGGPYGLQYQCVELVQRFYAQTWGYPPVWNAHAYQMFSTHPPDMVAIPNGGSPGPRWGDVLVFDRTPTSPCGHVAVVWAVRRGMIFFVEENGTATGWDYLPISSTNVISNSRGQFFAARPPIMGWLRSPRNATPAPTPTSSTAQSLRPSVHETEYTEAQLDY